jgi:Domain of unknown function (DUF4270)
MNKAKKLVVISCGLLTILNACKDNTGTLSPQILPKSDVISAFESDTSKVVTSMYLKDSALTVYQSTNLLGSFNDPVFGESKASIYAEVSPANTTVIPWGNLAFHSKVDSMVLLLSVEGQPYGSNDAQTIAVYQLADNIITPYSYYSDNTIKLHSTTPIGETQVVAPTGANDTLRISLTKAFMNQFLTNITLGPTNPYGAPANWNTNFNNGVIKGVYITTLNPLQLPGQGGVYYLNLLNSFSGINVYYHNLASDTEYSVTFPVGGSNGEYFNNFTHNYATSPIHSLVPSGPRDSVAAGQLIYVQSMGGVLGRINFPNLYKNWSKLGPLVVNEALLTLNVDQQYLSPSYALPSLYVVGTSSTWQGYGLTGGAEGSGTYNGNACTFIISQYIQSIIDGKNDTDRGLFIIPGNSNTSANSVVLYGAKPVLPANKATLTIYYTPLKKS